MAHAMLLHAYVSAGGVADRMQLKLVQLAFVMELPLRYGIGEV